MESTVNDRIILLIEHFARGRQKDFSEQIGLSTATLANIVGVRKTKPGFEILEKIVSAYPQINAEWLLKGDGEMLLDSSNKSNTFGHEVIESLMLKINRLEKVVETIVETQAYTIKDLAGKSEADSRARLVSFFKTTNSDTARVA